MNYVQRGIAVDPYGTKVTTMRVVAPLVGALDGASGIEGDTQKGTHEGCPYRAFGNPLLLERFKIGVLASGDKEISLPDLPQDGVVMSGFHSDWSVL